MAVKKITTQTLKEFQAWLDGVEELQAKGWTPDKQQWAKIRKRIANIVEEPVPVMPTMNPMLVHGATPPYGPGPAAPTPMMPGPAPIPDYDISPAAQALLTGATGKTPDVDASAGPVNSPFS